MPMESFEEYLKRTEGTELTPEVIAQMDPRRAVVDLTRLLTEMGNALEKISMTLADEVADLKRRVAELEKAQ